MFDALLAIPEKHTEDVLYPPTGLLYLAAAAIEKGYTVDVVDGQLSGDESIINALVQNKYKYFGTTVLSPLRHYSYELIRKVKRALPECIIIAGGSHVSILPAQTLEHVHEIDIIVTGEGERSFVEILSGEKLENIPGIWYRKDSEICHNKSIPPLSPEKIPMPAWDLIDIFSYMSYEDIEIDGIKLGPMLTIYSSRGCTGSCSFCSTWWVWKKWRQVSVERFVFEIQYLYDKGVNHFFIADDSMINNAEFVDNFLSEIKKRKIKIFFKIACRADKITPHIAITLKEAGCYEVHIGFESGSQRILDAIGKGLTVEQNINAALAVRNAGMRVYALMIIGHLDEDVESINQTIDFLKIIQPDVIASMNGLMLLPGTKDYNRAKHERFISDSFWLSHEPYKIYNLNFSRTELNYIRHLFDARLNISSLAMLQLQAKLFSSYIRVRKHLPFPRVTRLINKFARKYLL